MRSPHTTGGRETWMRGSEPGARSTASRSRSSAIAIVYCATPGLTEHSGPGCFMTLASSRACPPHRRPSTANSRPHQRRGSRRDDGARPWLGPAPLVAGSVRLTIAQLAHHDLRPTSRHRPEVFLSVQLLRRRRTSRLNRCDNRSRLIDQGFNDDSRHPGALHVQYVGSTRREVDDASRGIWAAIVDSDDDRAAIV